MSRFSAAILPVVILLMIAGGILGVIQVGSLSALWGTAYGTILVLKLIAVGALLILAAANRLVFTPALAQDKARQRPWFARSIAAEGVLVLLILGLVAGWRFTPPPRTNAAPPTGPSIQAPAPVSAHIHSGQAMAQLVFHPSQTGRMMVTIKLTSLSGAPLNPKEVMLVLSKPSSGIESLERTAVPAADVWQISDLALPVGGEWHVQVDALVSDFDKVTLEGAITIKP